MIGTYLINPGVLRGLSKKTGTKNLVNTHDLNFNDKQNQRGTLKCVPVSASYE